MYSWLCALSSTKLCDAWLLYHLAAVWVSLMRWVCLRGPAGWGTPVAGGVADGLRGHSLSPGTAEEPPATYNLIRITSTGITINCWFFRRAHAPGHRHKWNRTNNTNLVTIISTWPCSYPRYSHLIDLQMTSLSCLQPFRLRWVSPDRSEEEMEVCVRSLSLLLLDRAVLS
jgi:hypothetical protein